MAENKAKCSSGFLVKNTVAKNSNLATIENQKSQRDLGPSKQCNGLGSPMYFLRDSDLNDEQYMGHCIFDNF